MARPINYETAGALLDEIFAEAEAAFPKMPSLSTIIRTIILEENAGSAMVTPPGAVAIATDRLMSSRTQAYREVLIGCALARLLDPEINIRRPYANQGDAAYNGRTLDEQVINPFLHDHEIPSSRGPFLSVFRLSVSFNAETRDGVRDKAGFDALLICIEHLRAADAATARGYLLFLLVAFVTLRNAANITLLHVQRLSLDQYESLISELLQVSSGGRMPVLLAVAMFQTIVECFALNWSVEWQGINVADRASDVGGDITVKQNDEILLSVEVTERPIDRASGYNQTDGTLEMLRFLRIHPAYRGYQMSEAYH
jgi:SacI restriction endonuclease